MINLIAFLIFHLLPPLPLHTSRFPSPTFSSSNNSSSSSFSSHSFSFPSSYVLPFSYSAPLSPLSLHIPSPFPPLLLITAPLLPPSLLTQHQNLTQLTPLTTTTNTNTGGQHTRGLSRERPRSRQEQATKITWRGSRRGSSSSSRRRSSGRGSSSIQGAIPISVQRER